MTALTSIAPHVDIFTALHHDHEHVSICHQPPGGTFRATVVPATQAANTISALPESVNIWFGVNPVHPGTAGRGTLNDVTRWAGIWADLDVKPGGMPNFDASRAVIRDLTAMLNCETVATTYTGHGIQPLWALDPDDPTTDLTNPAHRARAISLLRRWGRLVTRVAAEHNGEVDPVYDLPRVLRAPGTHNVKDPTRPLPVTALPGTGYPLTTRDLADTLDAYGITELPEDTEQLGDIIAPPAEWEWATTTCPYARRMIAGWATDTPTARHPWLLAQATRLAAAHRNGCITHTDHDDARRTLTARFHHLLTTGQARREQPGETAAAYTWGRARVATMTPERVHTRELGDHTHTTGDDDLDGLITRPDPDAETLELATFWTARPVLAHLHDFARARRVAPWAVLGITLARVIATTPPQVVLPALIGGHGSLNLFIGIVGRSGAGKGTAEAAAADALHLPILTGTTFETATVGSGEGIAHAYVTRTKEGVEQHTTSVMFSISEVDTLSALTDRRGSTLLPELRRAWSGERLGFAYADPTKRLPVPAHSYRMTLIAGIQPERAAGLLDDAAGGTPQRFVWIPAEDPHAPDQPPDEPTTWTWTPPRVPPADRSGRRPMHLCDRARTEIDADRLARLRGHGHELDGHAMLARLKIAAALAILESRTNITDEDWDLAGTIHAKSLATRAAVTDTITAANVESNRRRAMADAGRAVLVDEHKEDAKVRRVAALIVRKVRAHSPIPSADLRRALPGRDREVFEIAVDKAVDAGQIEAETFDYQGQSGIRYRIVESAR